MEGSFGFAAIAGSRDALEDGFGDKSRTDIFPLCLQRPLGTFASLHLARPKDLYDDAGALSTQAWQVMSMRYPIVCFGLAAPGIYVVTRLGVTRHYPRHQELAVNHANKSACRDDLLAYVTRYCQAWNDATQAMKSASSRTGEEL